MGLESDEENSRNLRVKERKHYTEDCLQDEEIEGRRMFSVEEKLTCDGFESCFVDEMRGEDFNLKYLQEQWKFFLKPVKFQRFKTGMPSANFTVNDVRQCVGSRRVLDVMDVTTQKDIEMTMKDWCRYFENPNRDQLLNVISLEFSHTRLENYVESPTLVRQVDWVDWVWPRHLKESQTEGTNSLDEMKYPKVQKYCLMSVKGCYTDFHIDFGGTSVWYHILRGKKVFWLIPPTEKNLALYENWVLSGKQGDVFFGDTVEKCARVHLESGDTFFIPTGWIHAVYTPEDTIVFGGNFLHNFGIEKQLRIAEVEDLKEGEGWSGEGPQFSSSWFKFRYPFYTEILWYVVQRFVHCLLGKNYLICNESGEYFDPANEPLSSDALNLTPSADKDPKLLSLTHNPLHMNTDKFASPFKGIGEGNHDISSSIKKEPQSVDSVSEVKTVSSNSDVSSIEVNGYKINIKDHIHITKWEYNGLKAILKWLRGLPPAKKSVPNYIRYPDALLEDLEILLEKHKNDDPRLAITGKPSLFWLDVKQKPKPKPRSAPTSSSTPKSSKSGGSKGNNSSNARRRRTRCKKCEACLRADCGECHFCKDMKKFGGPGRMKQSCISRQCMAPVLPHTACCMICGRDGWDKLTNPPENENSSLMECSQCWEILHPKCLQEKNPDLPMESCINDDLPNSWECPKCCRNGKPDQIKPRQMKGKNTKGSDTSRLSVSTSENGALDFSNANDVSESLDMNQLKIEVGQNQVHHEVSDNKRNSDGEPLELMPQKKKVRFDASNIKQEIVDESNCDDLEENKTFSLSMNQMSSLQSCNGNYSMPEKQEEISNGCPTSPTKAAVEGIKKAHTSPSHIRSCARYPLQLKRTFKNEQGKVLRVKNINEKLEIRSKSKLHLGVPMKRHGETARERLFRNLKGLKKNLLIKTKSFGKCEDGNNGKPFIKDMKVIQSCDNVKIKQEVSCNLTDETKAELTSISQDKLIKSEKMGNKIPISENPKISSILRDNPHLKKPKYVVRPAPIVEDNNEEKIRNSSADSDNLALEKEVMLPVFQFLSVKDLYICQLVCKTWNRWSVDPRLWTVMDLTRRKITASTLIGIIRRQPVTLNLSWTNLSRRQLAWLIARLPQMKELILSGCSSASVVALSTCNCPLLRSLDLSWVEGLNDSVIRDLLSPPPDSRPGFIESKTRLRHLAEVKLAGADISDVSVRLLAHHLPLLSRIDLSHCHKVTDMGIAVLGAAKATRLHSLDVSSCSNITDTSLEALKRCTNLAHLDLRDCGQVTEAACSKFVGQNRQTLMQKEAKFIKKHF
ncbi:Lysine-specific demethylase 2B like protein [Argiope bruennichi]|uniref:[histone H3]-dimethyl-L-lysine(36) demethylase n=1 Tax=Argiope bruennichi TaxID=94029 RepID=A0A8T0FB45_ARGBR|nr:Lysine-specific demethylase 2B like protein [Argiope bruennichi]